MNLTFWVMTLQPTGLDSSRTHLFIFLNLIEALGYSYLYDYSQVYVTLLCLLDVTVLYLNNCKLCAGSSAFM